MGIKRRIGFTIIKKKKDEYNNIKFNYSFDEDYIKIIVDYIYSVIFKAFECSKVFVTMNNKNMIVFSATETGRPLRVNYLAELLIQG